MAYIFPLTAAASTAVSIEDGNGALDIHVFSGPEVAKRDLAAITHDAAKRRASSRATGFLIRIPDVTLGCLCN